MTAEALALLDTPTRDVPEAQTAQPAPDPREFEKVLAGVMRRLDRILSLLFRCDMESPDELEETVALMRPAARHYGGRISPAGWLLIALLGFVTFIGAKLVKRAQARAPETPETETKPARVEEDEPPARRPIYPERLRRDA